MASVVIHRYNKVSAEGVAVSKAHIRYIQHRRGEEKEREPGTEGQRFRRELFDGERDSIDRRELNNLIDRERQGGVAIHKLTLSPGVQGVDLKEYTREVMDALGQEKGLDLIWGAAIHRNTDHDHVHVVVLGSDANGHRVRVNRDDHDLLRHKSDQYLEREHAYDRELEREARDVERVTKEHGLDRTPDDGRAGRLFDERIGQILGKRQDREPDVVVPQDERAGRLFDERLEQIFGKAPGREREGDEVRQPWSREEALERLPESQKIEVQGEIYTKYNTKEELERLDEHLKSHYEDRIDKRQYAMLHRWKDAKERNGDDCYERWDERDFQKKQREGEEGREAHREWHELDKNARKFIERQEFPLNRHMPREQRIFEERGRMTEFHCTYQNLVARQALMDARERSQNPEVHKYVEKELQQLKEQQQEAMRDVPTLDLDSLYGKNADRDREAKTREPDRALNLDEMKFPDPLRSSDTSSGTREEKKPDDPARDKDGEKEQNRDEPLRSSEQEAPSETKMPDDATKPQDDTQQQTLDDRTQELTDAQHGQEMHEGTVFKQKTDDREDDEREHEERER